jgi:hypothetical protein
MLTCEYEYQLPSRHYDVPSQQCKSIKQVLRFPFMGRLTCNLVVC